MRAPSKTISRAQQLRREMSLPEVLLWTELRRDHLGLRVRRQHPVGPYILDFYISSARLAIEVDGAAHDICANAERDTRRDTWLRVRGVRVLRFPAQNVLDRTRRDDVLATILAALAER